jgi:RimJ/RimL family protein N-acetyltransferase
MIIDYIWLWAAVALLALALYLNRGRPLTPPPTEPSTQRTSRAQDPDPVAHVATSKPFGAPMLPLTLLPLDVATAADLAAGDYTAVAGSNLRAVEPLVRQVAAAHLSQYQRAGCFPPWIGYLARVHATGEIVGAAGFKGRPRDGVVEIAYFTFPGYEGRGFARDMAAALSELAWNSGGVVETVAHTLPASSASTRVLERLGFSLETVLQHPEDGIVWRWSLPAPEQEGLRGARGYVLGAVG